MASLKIAVVGQGIAGSLLAWRLQELGADVTLLGDGSQSASEVAAGLINPVTGQRYTLSWRFGTLYAQAVATYRALETALGQTFWHAAPIIRLLDSAEALNTWNSRSALPEVRPYLQDHPDAGEWMGLAVPAVGYGLLPLAARVDFPALIRAVRQHFLDKRRYETAHLCADDAPALLQRFDHVVWTTGYGIVQHPAFVAAPWLPAKGEALRIRLPNLYDASIQQTLKRTVAIVPLGDATFWAGANYEWHFAHAEPSAVGRAFVQNELQRLLAVPYEVVGHVAQVRAVVQDRRPVLGTLADQPRVHIFGALGSKGALLAPYFAHQMADYLLLGKPLEASVNWARFGSSKGGV